MKLQAVCQVKHGHFYLIQKVTLHWLLELHWCTKLGQEGSLAEQAFVDKLSSCYFIKQIPTHTYFIK